MLISNAYAQEAAAGAAQAAPNPFGSIGFLVLMFVVLWFIMVRPQMKRAKEHKTMVSALSKGDEVITQGGIAGKVADLDDNFISVEIAPNIKVSVQRQAIATVLPKGTLKA